MVGTSLIGRQGILAAAVLAALALPAAAQVRQIQMGNSMDANPSVGSGGSNRPINGYVPVNGNEIMTGNVSGLGYFHGAQRQVAPGVYRSSIGTFSPYEFRGSLGSSSLSGFARQSAGGYQSSAGLNQVYYLPSATVSTGAGGLYSSPIGSGFDSALVPRVAISPTANAAQVNGLLNNNNNFAAAGAGLNREVAPPPLEAGAPGAVLSNPLFVLRTTELPPAPLKGTTPGLMRPVQPTMPATAPSSPDFNAGPDPEKVNPAMIQGNTSPALVVGQSREIKSAKVSEAYARLSGELAGLVGPATLPAAAPDPIAEKTLPAAPGLPENRQDIDPFTGKPRMIATLQKPGALKPAATSPAKPGEPAQPSAHGLATASTNLLTAGSKVKPIRLSPEAATAGPVAAYDLTMAKAEQSLKAGRYLEAAETYQAALGLKPEDPLALVGRAHAEFGAGFYTTAAYDLKFVFIRKPEMVSVRYDVASFIPAQRQEFLMEDLQKLTLKKESADAASFLYCYLCYQTGRTTALQAELKKWSERDSRDEWQVVLNRAWVQQKPAESAPAPR
jgi:hypothetical protein